jgi:anaerobic selenocysteine-containing dehydrogenase
VVKLEGNPEDPNARGKICARGLASVNRVYDPERILYPLKRVGERGEGKWRRISWDNALDEIASRLKAVQDGGMREECFYQIGLGALSQVSARFWSLFGRSVTEPSNKEAGLRLTWGDTEEVSDAGHAAYILDFGSNFYEEHPLYIPFMQRIVEARVDRRAKVVTFDSRVHNTSAGSDEWFIWQSGTGGIVALAMCHVIVDAGLLDDAFVHRWTNVSVPQLKQYLARYSPDRAERASGISAAEIRRIALEGISQGPAVALSGEGLTAHSNGTQGERAVALLNALLGAVDREGGRCLPRKYAVSLPPAIEEGFTKVEGSLGQREAVSPSDFIERARVGKSPVPFFLACQANPAFAYPDTQLVGKILGDEKRIALSVTVDTHLTETAMLADLFLPDATFLESWSLESPPALDLIPYVSVGQPLVRPVGQSRPFADVTLDLARRLGGKAAALLPFRSPAQVVASLVGSTIGSSEDARVSYVKERGIWKGPDATAAYRSYEEKGFKTPSGKYEIFSADLDARGISPLPAYESAPNGSSRYGDLVLIVFTDTVVEGGGANSKWLNELTSSYPVWIHPATAQARGIENGDRVEVFSWLGSVKARARYSEGIHPETVALSAQGGHWAHGRLARGQSFKSQDPDTSLVWWKGENRKGHPHILVPFYSDPIGGGQAWKETKVSIRKL